MRTVQLLMQDAYIVQLHCPVNAEIMAGDGQSDSRIFFIVMIKWLTFPSTTSGPGNTGNGVSENPVLTITFLRRYVPRPPLDVLALGNHVHGYGVHIHLFHL